MSFFFASGLLDDISNIAKRIANDFGLDVNLFISQAVAFSLVIVILYLFAFKRLLKMLDQRSKRIAENEQKIIEVDQKLVAVEEEKKTIIRQANNDAKRLVEEAKTSADKIKEQKLAEANLRAEQVVSKAQEAAALEAKTTRENLKQELGNLVVLTTAKVTGKYLSEDDQQQIKQDSISKIS